VRALQLKQELLLLRLRGGEFKVRGRQGMGQSILEVSPTGRLALYEIVVPSRDRGLSAERPAGGPLSVGHAALSRVSQVTGMGASGADLLPAGGQVPLAGAMGSSTTSILSAADGGADGPDGQPQFRCAPALWAGAGPAAEKCALRCRRARPPSCLCTGNSWRSCTLTRSSKSGRWRPAPSALARCRQGAFAAALKRTRRKVRELSMAGLLVRAALGRCSSGDKLIRMDFKPPQPPVTLAVADPEELLSTVSLARAASVLVTQHSARPRACVRLGRAWSDVLGSLLTRYNRCKVRQVKRLAELIELKTTPFSRSCPHHEQLLHRLWTGIFPGEPLEGRISDKWKLLGFQVGMRSHGHPQSRNGLTRPPARQAVRRSAE